jgi:glutathione S-transferase
MPLTLYYHPLSSFCWKALIALYEKDLPFNGIILDAQTMADFKRRWPIGRFPALTDGDRFIPEATIVIDYLDQHYPGPVRLIPSDPDAARETRLRDRFYDLYVHVPMQKVINDRLRPADARDPHGVTEARELLQTALNLAEAELAGRTWATGEAFSLADCAAAPALFYADKVAPFTAAQANVAAYLERLKQRPSFARVLAEAAPFFAMFPASD